MQKVINGKRYNTDTATMVGRYENSYGHNDFNYCCEELYITKNKNFFVYGEGGAMSRWSRSVGDNGSRGGEDIIPCSKEEALAWCEQHNIDADTIAQYFDIQDA